MQSANLRDDPIGYVLERLWADLTEGGRVDVNRRIQETLASRNYPEAMMLAIAIELDAAKRDDSVAFFDSEIPTKPMALDEMGRRTLFSFLMMHQNDFRTLRKERAIPPPPPPMKTIELPKE